MEHAERYVIRGGVAGAARLAVLARAWLPTTEALFDRVGVGVGQRCLDLGCGGGDVTLVLGRRVGPRGLVVGVDMDRVKLDLAGEAAAEEGLTHVRFVQSDVYDWSEPDTYDVVYCRFVLEHLGRPVDVLRAMWAAVRPGGVLLVEDADFDAAFCWPPDPGHGFWRERYQEVLRRHGGDPLVGRKLLSLFLSADIPTPELSLAQTVTREGDAKTLPCLTVEATADAMVAAGVATADEIAAALADLQSFTADPTTVVGSPRLTQAWTRRPAS